MNGDVPNWGFADYFPQYSRLLDVRRLVSVFLTCQSKTMIDRRGMRRDTDVGAWDRR